MRVIRGTQQPSFKAKVRFTMNGLPVSELIDMGAATEAAYRDGVRYMLKLRGATHVQFGPIFRQEQQ